MGYGLVPMLGGIFELVARTAIVLLVAGKTSFAGICMADPAAWIAALIPLIPYYYYIMKKYKKQTVAPFHPLIEKNSRYAKIKQIYYGKNEKGLPVNTEVEKYGTV